MTAKHHHLHDVSDPKVIVRVVFLDPLMLIIIGHNVDLDADLVGCLDSLGCDGRDQTIFLLVALLLDALLLGQWLALLVPFVL